MRDFAVNGIGNLRALGLRMGLATADAVAKFETYERSLELAATVKPIIEIVGTRDRNLADQMRRASASVSLNLSEGAQRIGRDRTNLYLIASGSAAELQTALKLAVCWG